MYPPFICIIVDDDTIFAEDDDILNQKLLASSAKSESYYNCTIWKIVIFREIFLQGRNLVDKNMTYRRSSTFSCILI